MTGGISLFGGQIVIPATISLPLSVIIIGGLLAIVGAIALICLWIAAQASA